MTIQIQIRREFRCTDVFRGWGSVEVSHLPAGKEEDGLNDQKQQSFHFIGTRLRYFLWG